LWYRGNESNQSWRAQRNEGENMKNRALKALFGAFIALGFACAAAAQYVPGAQPVVYPTYQPAATNFTAASQNGTAFTSTALRSAVIVAVQNGPTPAALTGVVSGTTTSVETWTTNAATDTIGGTVAVTPSGLSACTITFPAYTTLASAVTLFNANTVCNSTDGLTASASTNHFILTQGGVSLTITDNGSTLVNYKASTATWALQGSIEGVNWFAVPTAALPTTSVPVTTTAVSQATATTTQTAATMSYAYMANISGWNHFRFATTSGTFTASSALSLAFSGTPHATFF
jgi:hypothetical protein